MWVILADNSYAIILTYCSVSANVKMLSLEFSYGRFKGEDIRSLMEPLTVLVARIG